MCDYNFFFSSRRRHTRCSRDWSSDVCSSDLFTVHKWKEYGFRLIGFWTPVFGEKSNQVVYIWGWDSYEERTRKNRSEEHTSELQSRLHLVCRLLLEKKKQFTTRSSLKRTNKQ